MTLKRQSFNNGAQGSVITSSNSASSGDALDATQQAGTGNGTYEVAAAIKGAKGAHVTGALNDIFQLILSNTSATSGTAMVYFEIVSYPTVGGAFFRLRSSTGNIAIFRLSETGLLVLQNSVGTDIKTFMSGNPLSLNTTYRIQLQATPNTTTTTGYISGQLFDDDNNLLDTYASNTQNAGTTLDVQTVSAGKVVAGTDGFNMYFDELTFETASITQLTDYPYVRINSAEGGFDGLDVTTSNSGGNSGDNFSSVAPNGGSITYSSAVKHSGLLSYNFTAASGLSARISYSVSAVVNLMQTSFRGYVYLTGNPSAATQLVDIGNTNSAGTIAVLATGVPITQQNGGTANTGSSPLPLNTWLRLELTVIVGTTSSNGTIIVNIFSGDTITSPVYSYSSSAMNTTTSPLTYMNFGKCSGSGSWATLYFDDISYAESTAPAPYNAAIVPWFKA